MQPAEFLFVASGVLTPPLLPHLKERILQGVPADDYTCLKPALVQALNSLAAGGLDAAGFWERIASLLGRREMHRELEARFLDGFHLNLPTWDIACQLRRLFRVSFVLDYPFTWWEAAWANVSVASRDGEINLISAGTALVDRMPENVPALLKFWRINPSRCLCIDAHPRRAVLAVRQGVHAMVYVDEFRLRRELVLRRILPELSTV